MMRSSPDHVVPPLSLPPSARCELGQRRADGRGRPTIRRVPRLTENTRCDVDTPARRPWKWTFEDGSDLGPVKDDSRSRRRCAGWEQTMPRSARLR